ncbi:SAF domain-containing protein, partial [Frankia canadensis]|uniref:SAF domain-containing protein n=1 Tax=Frankia canadensis TaxID=1836972 RepID=UPI00311A938B
VFVVVGGRRDGRREVLVVTRPVQVGQLVTAGDVRVVSVVVEPAVEVVPVGSAGQVVGRPAAVPLSAGSLLSRSSVGRRSLPAGMRLVGASLKPGSYPPGVSAGDQVMVLLTGDTARPAAVDGSGASVQGAVEVPSVARSSSVEGVLVSAEPGPAGSGGLVVSVQVGADDAEPVARAAAAGQVALVLRGAR